MVFHNVFSLKVIKIGMLFVHKTFQTAIRLVKNAKASVYCTGYFLKPDQLEEFAKNGDAVPSSSNKPSSQMIADAFEQNKGIPSETEVSELAAQVVLHPDEVQMWLKHPATKCVSEQEGRRKEGSPKENGLLKRNCFE